MRTEDELDDSASYIAPDYSQSRVYDLGLDQQIWASVWLILATWALFSAPDLILKAVIAVMCLIIGVLGAWSYNEGQGYLIPGDHLKSRGSRKNGSFISSEDPNFASNSPTIKISLSGIPLGNEKPDKTNHLLPTGFITSSDRGRIAFVIACGGTRRASFDWDQRMTDEQAVVDVIAQAAAIAGYEASRFSVASIVGVRPADPHPVLETLAWALHPDFIDPEPGTPEAKFANAGDIRLETMYLTGSDPVSAYVITLNTPPSWRKALAGGSLASADIDNSMVRTIVDHLVSGFDATGIVGAKCLNLLELDEFVRVQLNIAKSGLLHKWLAERRMRYRSMSTDDIIADLLANPPWPDNLIRIARDYIYANGTYFRMFRTVNFRGRRIFRPGGSMLLQLPPKTRWNTTTTCGAVVSALAEEKRLTRSITWRKAIDLMGKENDKYLSKREREERQRSEDEQSKIYDQDAPVIKSDRIIAVGAPTKKLLFFYSAMTVAAHTLRMVGIVPVILEVRQSRALSRCLLGFDD